jgi:hypothetical protein
MFNSNKSQPRKTKAQLLGPSAQVCKKSKFVARNTIEWYHVDGTRNIRLHETDVISYLPNGRIRLTSGGWKTPVTRGRLNDHLPIDWSVTTQNGTWRVNTPAGQFLFIDGAEFFAKSGNPCKPKMHGSHARSLASDEKLIREYMAALKAVDPDELTGMGDPFVAPAASSLKYNESHVRTWLIEKYIFMGFLRAASAYSGHSPDSAAYFLHEYKRTGVWPGHFLRSVRRYIRACLGHPV